MAYIYKIINDVNEKVYIGKTNLNIEKRFKEHCRDSGKERCECRPLYSAMNKYGLEHFRVELVEETHNPEERERYWIAFYHSYVGDSKCNGYNATMGGDGKPYLNYDKIVEVYKIFENTIKTAEVCNCSIDQVRNVLKMKNINIRSSSDILKEQFGRRIYMLNKNTGECLKTFETEKAAAKFLIDHKHAMDGPTRGIITHIAQACNGKRKSAYGFVWKRDDSKSNYINTGSPCKVSQYDINGNFIQRFNSYSDAAQFLKNNGESTANLRAIVSSISKVARGKKNRYLNYIWKLF